MTESKSAADVQKDVAVMREWLSKQPHLPQNINDHMMRRFLHSCYYSLERTKKCMDLFFTIRAASPEMLSHRDPTSKEMKTVFEITNLATIRMRDNSNLIIWQLNDPGMDKFDYLGDARMFFSQSDVWLLEDEFLEARDICMMDAKDVSLKFLTKFNVSAAKKLSQYQQEALPVRLKEVHVVNCPSFMDKIFSLMKPFIGPEICKMIHFHTPNSDTLYKFVSKEELPSDYGGEAASMADHMRQWVDRMVKQREFLMNEKQWMTDETKRPKDNKYAQASLQNGSFRKLELD